MSLLSIAGMIVLGLFVGTLSGMVGIGGGILVIPCLMFFLGFSQQRANGTSLAMLLPPIGVFAVMAYHRAGNIDWPVAVLLALAFAPGAYFGAALVKSQWISEQMLRMLFGIFLLYIAGRFLFLPGTTAGAAIRTFGLMGAFIGVWLVAHITGRKLAKAPYWPSVYQERVKRADGFDYEI